MLTYVERLVDRLTFETRCPVRVAAMLLRARARRPDRWRAVSVALDRERRSDWADGAASLAGRTSSHTAVLRSFDYLAVFRNGHLHAV